MTTPGLGEGAALATAACWAGCAQLFGAAGLRIGSAAVNHLRLAGAVLLLSAAHGVWFGRAWPLDLPPSVLLLFALSGIAGLTLGDAFLFHAFVTLGPAVSTLVMTLVPGFAALLAAVALGESMSGRAVAGMAVTLAGVALAVRAKSARASRLDGPRGGGRALVVGLLCAVLGAVGQASGVVLAKPALAEAPALSGTVVRMVAGAGAAWGFTGLQALVRRRPPAWWRGARDDRGALGLTLAGTLVGPFLGVWLSLVATKHALVGVAATLMSVTPVFVMAVDGLVLGRRPRAGELVGAAVAIAGVALLVTGPG